MEPAIRYVIVYPKNQIRARYYINDNLRDTHTMRYEELYRWLCEHISPPITVTVSHYLHTFQPFIVDIGNNAVARLSTSFEKEMEEIARQSRQIDFQEVYEQAQKEYLERANKDPMNQLSGGRRKKSDSMRSDSMEALTKTVLGSIIGF